MHMAQVFDYFCSGLVLASSTHNFQGYFTGTESNHLLSSASVKSLLIDMDNVTMRIHKNW